MLIDAVHPSTIKRRLVMLKPILSPAEWQAARHRMLTLQPRLLDPEQVKVWTGERQTRTSLRRSRSGRCPGSCSPTATPTPRPRRTWSWRSRSGGSCNELAQLVPGGRLVVATESGHDIQHEQPELVLDAVHDVVQAVRAGDLVPH